MIQWFIQKLRIISLYYLILHNKGWPILQENSYLTREVNARPEDEW